MEISEVRVKLVRSGPDKLQAFCSVTIDNSFVVRDLKVIEGSRGYFVAMPSRKLSDRCPRCDGKNHLRARFCNDCGARLPEDRAEKDPNGRARLHVDIAHPINSYCRDMIQKKVLSAFHEEMQVAKQTGYESSADSLDAYNDFEESEDFTAPEQETDIPAQTDSPVQKADDSFGKGLF